jgi:serine phosphatase RsbU (regulator of sigma subunit)
LRRHQEPAITTLTPPPAPAVAHAVAHLVVHAVAPAATTEAVAAPLVSPECAPAPESRPTVLLVDDQPANLIALEALLSDMDLDILTAESGEDALRRLLEVDVALILMDVRMPGMDGFEAAELIHRRKRSQHTPIIFLTASEATDEQALRGYGLGAVDYMVKPIIPVVLRSKVGVFVDIHRKAAEIQRQSERLLLLEQREHERQFAEARARWEMERLNEEIRIARQIQQKLFPVAPLPLPGLDIAGASFPAEATGGDYFDYIPMADGGLAVVVGDVCGHGFGPALLMAELRAYLRAFLLTRTDVSEALGLLNRALCGDTDRFVTLLVAKFDPTTRGFVFAGAGHTPGYILGADGEVKSRLESTGFPLAIVPEGEYSTVSAPPLQPGELALFLTDGIVEAHTPGGDLFGTTRALEVVRAHQHEPARAIINALYGAVRDFCGPAAPPDDMTAIVVKAE